MQPTIQSEAAPGKDRCTNSAQPRTNNDSPRRRRPVRWRESQDLLEQVSKRPGSVRPEVPSARRRVLPSQLISVTATLTQTSVPRFP